MAAYIIAVSSLTGCFTGVESTPKITPKELKKQKIVTTPESRLLRDIGAQAPSEWKPGKQFYIADARAARGAWRVDPLSASDSIEGRIAVLRAIDTVPSLTGRPDVQLSFDVPGSDITMDFRPGFTLDQWNGLTSFTLPHFIDMDVVTDVRNTLRGNTYYILPARRLGFDGVDTVGTRYVPVTVVDVLPATEATPLRVVFADDEGHVASVPMTIGDATTARRNFETIFSIENPRLKYKHIADDTWQLIRHSRVRAGMTPEECRLALGSPDSYTRIPTTAGMVERWSYTNGVYLMFEDGLLSRFNL